MKIADFEIYKDLLYKESGLVVTPDKSYLLDSRLTPVARKWKLPTLDAMTFQLRSFPDRKLVKDIVEAMTTNETSFFRDMRPFQTFEETILPYMQKRRAKKTLRIWCAACSSGQEPYSLAMILKDRAAQMPGWKFEILATDISDEMLEFARAGLYSQFEVQRGLPVNYLMKYFVQSEGKWQLKDDIRKMVSFNNFNLLRPMDKLGPFDIVFCRNVLIYFDARTKTDILNRMTARLEKDGFMMLGGAETILGLTDKLKLIPEKRGLYAHADSVHLNPAEKTSLTDTLKSMMRI
jgi:chemotaxis protein methyltransferase CheR